MIAANNVTYRVGKKEAFSKMSTFNLQGNCYGLGSANGEGKSRLVKY